MEVIKVLNSLLWPHAEKKNTNFYDIKTKNHFFFGFFLIFLFYWKHENL